MSRSRRGVLYGMLIYIFMFDLGGIWERGGGEVTGSYTPGVIET